jgi:hypothetical protein
MKHATTLTCLVAFLGACGSSNSTSTTGSSGNGSSSTGTAGNGSGTASSSGSSGASSGGAMGSTVPGSGTFTASGADAGTVTVSFAPQVMVSGASLIGYQFTVNDSLDGGAPPGTIRFTSPADIDSAQLALNVYLPGNGPPTTGTINQATSGACGDESFIYSNPTLTTSNSFTSGHPFCPDSSTTDQIGSFSLNFTSVTQGETDNNITYYLVHGSFTAAMVDGYDDMGTLNLNF